MVALQHRFNEAACKEAEKPDAMGGALYEVDPASMRPPAKRRKNGR